MAVGAIVTKALRKKFESIFPDRSLLIAYGMTEGGVCQTKEGEYKINGSVGSLLYPNNFVKIVDEEGNAVDIGEVGEICAKSYFKFLVSQKVQIKFYDS